MSKSTVHVIGTGLAGSEAAYFLAEHDIQVLAFEMRPLKMTPAHQTEFCAELVCSNSFKSKATHSAPGMLKSEMSRMGSLTLRAAAQAAIPGGEALTVDRKIFSEFITRSLRTHPNIVMVNEEVRSPSEAHINVIATGPLTSEPLTAWIARKTSSRDLYFYDAIAPIVDTSSILIEDTFLANRYQKGGEDAYVNCPFTEEEYYAFVNALNSAEKVHLKSFEKEKYYQGCQPVEVIAASGKDSLRFGPMKPVGLVDPKTGRQPFAVVQLRPENNSKSAYNLVGFQTKLKYQEQKKVFGMIPALKHAEFLRYGSIHRNTYVCSPRVLRPDLSLKGSPKIYLAGQITGVEGYLESAASGLMAAMFILQRILKKPHFAPPCNTALGSLLKHIMGGATSTWDGKENSENFQPSGIQFGLFEPLLFTPGKTKDESRQIMAREANEEFTRFVKATTLFQ